jgi:Fur family transcriptional regulator, stress-responsive regulator
MIARDRLRAGGLRVTAPRVGVLDAVDALGGHQDAATIATTARERIGSVSTQAVYEILSSLTEAGLLRRIEPAGRPALYESRVGDNHHHIVCRSCGAIEDVDCVVGEAPCLHPVGNAGMEIDEAEIFFWGRCVSCRSAAA